MTPQAKVGHSVAAEHQEAARAVDMERVVHRMVARHLVEQPELDPVAGGFEQDARGPSCQSGFP